MVTSIPPSQPQDKRRSTKTGSQGSAQRSNTGASEVRGASLKSSSGLMSRLVDIKKKLSFESKPPPEPKYQYQQKHGLKIFNPASPRSGPTLVAPSLGGSNPLGLGYHPSFKSQYGSPFGTMPIPTQPPALGSPDTGLATGAPPPHPYILGSPGPDGHDVLNLRNQKIGEPPDNDYDKVINFKQSHRFESENNVFGVPRKSDSKIKLNPEALKTEQEAVMAHFLWTKFLEFAERHGIAPKAKLDVLGVNVQKGAAAFYNPVLGIRSLLFGLKNINPLFVGHEGLHHIRDTAAAQNNSVEEAYGWVVGRWFAEELSREFPGLVPMVNKLPLPQTQFNPDDPFIDHPLNAGIGLKVWSLIRDNYGPEVAYGAFDPNYLDMKGPDGKLRAADWDEARRATLKSLQDKFGVDEKSELIRGVDNIWYRVGVDEDTVARSAAKRAFRKPGDSFSVKQASLVEPQTLASKVAASIQSETSKRKEQVQTGADRVRTLSTLFMDPAWVRAGNTVGWALVANALTRAAVGDPNQRNAELTSAAGLTGINAALTPSIRNKVAESIAKQLAADKTSQYLQYSEQAARMGGRMLGAAAGVIQFFDTYDAFTRPTADDADRVQAVVGDVALAMMFSPLAPLGLGLSIVNGAGAFAYMTRAFPKNFAHFNQQSPRYNPQPLTVSHLSGAEAGPDLYRATYQAWDEKKALAHRNPWGETLFPGEDGYDLYDQNGAPLPVAR